MYFLFLITFEGGEHTSINFRCFRLQKYISLLETLKVSEDIFDYSFNI